MKLQQQSRWSCNKLCCGLQVYRRGLKRFCAVNHLSFGVGKGEVSIWLSFYSNKGWAVFTFWYKLIGELQANARLWSSPSPRGLWRTGKNGGNWLQNHLWCPNVPRSQGIDDYDEMMMMMSLLLKLVKCVVNREKLFLKSANFLQPAQGIWPICFAAAKEVYGFVILIISPHLTGWQMNVLGGMLFAWDGLACRLSSVALTDMRYAFCMGWISM